MLEIRTLALLFVVGLVAGVVNVLAGGGSFLTLPVLILAGLPATVANGTNRVGILVQNVGAVWGFERHRLIEWRWFRWTALPALVGALAGTGAALVVTDEAFRKVLAILMVVVASWTLLSSRLPASSGSQEPPSAGKRMGTALAFFGIGIYGGFVQAGVGFFILAGTTWIGLDLVRGNALKVVTILALTLVALMMFVVAGKVDWQSGLVLACGTFLGGQVGVRLTVSRGHGWLRGVVLLAIVFFAVRLWFFS